MKIKYALGASAVCLAGLASELPRDKNMSGAHIIINEAKISSAGQGRLNVTLLADVDLSGMPGSVSITTSGIPKYKEFQVFFQDPKIENMDYEFPGMNVSSQEETRSGANAFVTYMLPSLTRSALDMMQDMPIGALPQETWKHRAMAAVLSDIEVSDNGFDIVLYPARIIPHAIRSRSSHVVLGIIMLCGLIIYGLRSTKGSTLTASRRMIRKRSSTTCRSSAADRTILFK
jgi:hypothetical protein